MKRLLFIVLLTLASHSLISAEVPDTVSHELQEVVVDTRRSGTRKLNTVEDKLNIGKTELFRAACCNLGESFATNPSVDVSYDDAATGARQIKLLGLGGAYVQMLEENIPTLYGAAAPFGLGYVPGSWMKSIQVSKGSASVKNGPESITGQTNVEYLKPQDKEEIQLNAYFDSKLGAEANAVANKHISDKLSSSLLLHWEDDFKQHDTDHDGFADAPRIRQAHAMNRWAYFSPSYIMQARLEYLNEVRKSGQVFHGSTPMPTHDIYKISIATNRWGLWAKNAFIFNSDHNSNIALITSATLHNQNSTFGRKIYDVDQFSGYASLIFETDFSSSHKLSSGLSLNADRLSQNGRFTHSAEMPLQKWHENETRYGAYAQYTFSAGDKFTAMAGARIDHSSLYGWFVTPRAHIRYTPLHGLSLRASAGKGFRTVHPYAENVHLISSGRTLIVDSNLPQEEAYNYGASLSWETTLFSRRLTIGLEYYYTDFHHQVLADYDSDPSIIHVTALKGKSYSHNWQAELTYQPFRGFSFTAAYRRNDVKATFHDQLMAFPLTNRYKALLTASYATPLSIWVFDITTQFNGGGRLPQPTITSDGTTLWNRSFHAFTQLSAQITRNFRHLAIYIGGENLTAFRQKNPIINAADPWSSTFDPTLIWGPVHGAMVYAGVRINI